MDDFRRCEGVNQEEGALYDATRICKIEGERRTERYCAGNLSRVGWKCFLY